MWARRGFLLTASILAVLSCVKVERYGKGDIRELILVEDRLGEEGRALEARFGRTYRVPQEEALFKIIHLKPEQFETYRGYKNVLILASPASESRSLFVEAFGEKDPGIYVGSNVFGPGDFVIGVFAPKEELLRSFVDSEMNAIEDAVMGRLYKFYEKKVYFSGRNKRLSKEIQEKYGFTLDLPEGYGIVREEENFVSFAKHFPDRFLFVYWEDNPRSLEPGILMDLRDSLTRQYYDDDYIERGLSVSEKDSFQGEDAVRVIGVWQNDEEIMGGPFQFLAFNHKDRFWMVDMGVYAPDKVEKLEYVLREEIVARTLTLD
jgi:hypothetical protein